CANYPGIAGTTYGLDSW
nr:immunoglobulin heavy chain junction region [Macaca mulatta]MOX93063.1 immunoglobulin heavy chain junction region [Macaca mulatta]MOX94007.1 immunoglobulin heavy chain junction region [Macaca mulatta]MOX96040.1 immunoglobulin heavy chain junction region [Macaca mulatta]